MRNHGLRSLMFTVALGALVGCDGGSYDPTTGRFLTKESGKSSATRTSDAGAEPTSPRAQTVYDRGQGVTVIALNGQPGSSSDQDPPPYSHSYALPTTAPEPTDARPAEPSSPFARTVPAGTGAKPSIAGVSPASGPAQGGNVVVVAGSDFANVQVLFNGQMAQIASQSSNAVSVIAPAASPGSVAVVLTNGDGSYSVAASAYTYR
jgi:IPT/TIG domain